MPWFVFVRMEIIRSVEKRMDLPDYLVRDDRGEIRLKGHRIGLSHVLRRYNDGYSPEMIVCQYPTLPLSLVYKVISFYLDNLEPVDAYLAACKEVLDRLQESTAPIDFEALRRRLESMRRSQGA